MVLSGHHQWAQEIAELTIRQSNFEKTLWAGDRKSNDFISINQYRHYLGHEFNAVIYNAHSGIRANALMALSGSVSSQGLMILLCPDFTEWPHFNDPEARNKVSYGYTLTANNSYFVHWLIARLQQDEFVTVVTEQQFYPAKKQAWAKDTSILFEHQQEAILAIQKTALGRNNRPLVLTADRGRGKTSALGIATASLFQQGFKKIIITAPSFNTVALAFKHGHALLNNSELNNQSLIYKEARLDFCALDELLERGFTAEIIFVDEAAAIPTDMLKKICKQFPKVILSTTIHGYEGSGRGFELRFKPFLNQHFKAWKMVHLDHPLRWFKGDVLEEFWFKTMLMHSVKPLPANVESSGLPFKCRKIEKSELLKSPALLAEIFHLLINAHYQTSPDDLNRMLDAQEQHIYGAFNPEGIAAVVLASNEGGEQIADLGTDISSGKRRVQGHLVAQSILYQTGAIEYAQLSYLRIVRIAVLPGQQRKGLATKLLSFVKQNAKGEGIDFFCVSYGLDLALLHFWFKNHFSPIKLGTKRDASSGEHSIIMLSPLTENNRVQLHVLSNQFHLDLIYQASRHFNRLKPALLSALLCLNKTQQLSDQQRIRLKQLVNKTRHWDSCESTIRQLVLSTTELPNQEVIKAHSILAALFIQNCDPLALQKDLNLTGKKQLSQTIVASSQLLLSCT